MSTATDWIEHDGKGMPVNPEKRVEVRFRDGDTRVTRAGWHHSSYGSNWVFYPDDPDYDIVAYRVVSQ